MKASPAGKCGTSFGDELPTPDGLISWNDGGSFNTAGAADVTCADKTRIGSVSVYGYFGTPTEQFNVTFYKNSSTDGSDEPDDTLVKCTYSNLTGTAGGQYPVAQLTKLKLPTKCKIKGHVWVSVQNNDAAGPWYWEMTNTASGAGPDWDDVNNAFGTGCTTFNNDKYLNDCFAGAYPYPDWMLKLGK